MLSDREREALREIQRQVFVDDPDFERSFRALEAPKPPSPHRWAYRVVVVIAAFLTVAMVVAGSAGGALAFAVVAGAVWLAQHLEHTGQGDRVD